MSIVCIEIYLKICISLTLYPKVNIIKNDTYVSIRQCIADFLGKGYSPDKRMDKTPLQINKLVDAPIAKEVYDRAIEMNVGVIPDDILVVLGVQWSDDFEPNGSSKSNRGSVWIKTVTFISSSESKNKLSDTYPISIGLKATDHNNIENMSVDECVELSNGTNNIF